MSEKRQHLGPFGTPNGEVCKQYATESSGFRRIKFTAHTRKSAQTPKKQGFWKELTKALLQRQVSHAETVAR